MNQSPIDVMLQLPIPRVEPALAGPRARDDSSAFDNHFRRASIPDTPPPIATQPSRGSDDSRNNDSSQTPAAATGRSTSSQTSTAAEPASASEPSANGDKQETSSDTGRDEDATVDETIAAVATGKVAEPAGPNLAGESNGSPTDIGDNPAFATSVDEQRPREKEAQRPQSVRSTTDHRADTATSVRQNAPRDGQPAGAQNSVEDRNTEQSSNTVNSELEFAADQVTASAVPETPDAADAPQLNTRRDEKARNQLAAGTAAAKQAAGDGAAAPAGATEKPAKSTEASGEPVADAASRKDDKKTNARSIAIPVEASAPPTERPAAIADAADTPAVPAGAVVSQPQVPAANFAAATANPATKPQDTQSASKPGFLSPFARLERGAQSARNANRAGYSDAPRHVDPARFVSRVARAISTAQERGGPLQLRLSPPELGAMRLELSLSQGTLNANIETDNSTTRQLLLDNLPALRERLAEQNVKIERFDVDVRRDPSGNQQNTAPQDRGQAERQDRRPGRNSASRTGAASPAIEESATVRRNISNTSINLVA